MEKNKKRDQVYKSIREFEEKFFPNSIEKSLSEVSTDARASGISLAQESLNRIRKQLEK